MKKVQYINSPVGKIGIIEEEKNIVRVGILDNEYNQEEMKEEETEILKEAKKQLTEYFLKKRTKFDLPLNPKGTDFMKKVWKALMEIPYGEVRTYKEIAIKIGSPKSSRAVGMANHKNPIPIIIPCHRVIGSNGKLVGYALGLDIKDYLLNLEK